MIFLVKSLKNWGHDDFTNRTARVTKIWSHGYIYNIIESGNKILLVTSWTKIMTLWTLFQNIVILRRPGETIFAGIIKIVTMFIKIIFKDSRKVKRIRNYVSKCNLYLYFLIQQNLLISGEKMLMLAELRGCVTWFIYFLDLL